MRRGLLLAGAILAIAVLATSAIVPVVEAKPFSDRKDSGIVANCRVGHEGTSTINCTFSDKDGIGAVNWTTSSTLTRDTNGNCDNRFKDSLVTSDNADLQITITDCADNSITFCYEKMNGKLTQHDCVNP